MAHTQATSRHQQEGFQRQVRLGRGLRTCVQDPVRHQGTGSRGLPGAHGHKKKCVAATYSVGGDPAVIFGTGTAWVTPQRRMPRMVPSGNVSCSARLHTLQHQQRVTLFSHQSGVLWPLPAAAAASSLAQSGCHSCSNAHAALSDTCFPRGCVHVVHYACFGSVFAAKTVAQRSGRDLLVMIYRKVSVQWSVDKIKADPFFGKSRVRFRARPWVADTIARDHLA